MWVVARSNTATYWAGERNDWTSAPRFAAAWVDRRGAHRAAENLNWANRELYGTEFDCSETWLDLPIADRRQIIPERPERSEAACGEVEIKHAGGPR